MVFGICIKSFQDSVTTSPGLRIILVPDILTTLLLCGPGCFCRWPTHPWAAPSGWRWAVTKAIVCIADLLDLWERQISWPLSSSLWKESVSQGQEGILVWIWKPHPPPLSACSSLYTWTFAHTSVLLQDLQGIGGKCLRFSFCSILWFLDISLKGEIWWAGIWGKKERNPHVPTGEVLQPV